MKIGFNIQKIKDLIKNSISSLETRVTTLENNSGGGGGGTQLSSFNFKILNVNNIEILEKTVKSIENDLSISLVLQFTLQDTNRNMVDYGVIDLGSCKLSDNENQRYKCEGTLPIIYQKGDEVEINFDTGVITNDTTGKTYQAEPFPEFIQNIIAKGGLINSILNK